MWQNLIVALMVGAAAWWLGRRLWRTVSGQGPACGCGGQAEDAASGRGCGCSGEGAGGHQSQAGGCAGCSALAGTQAPEGRPPACQGCAQAGPRP